MAEGMPPAQDSASAVVMPRPLDVPHTYPKTEQDINDLLKSGKLDEKSAQAYLMTPDYHFVEVVQRRIPGISEDEALSSIEKDGEAKWAARVEREGELEALRLSTHLHTTDPRAANIRTNAGGKDQSFAMFGGPNSGAKPIGPYQGTAQSGQWTTTTLKDNGTTPAGWVANQWVGYILHVPGAATPCYGVITASPAGGVLNGTYTVDRFYPYGAPDGATAATPSGAITFLISGIAPWQFMALSTDAAAVVSDYAWTAEVTASGLTKVLASNTYTQPSASGNVATQTFQAVLSNVFTAAATVAGIVKVALSNSFVASIGLYPLIAPISSVNVIAGDTLTPTDTITG